MGSKSKMKGLIVLACLFVVWHASVEALPFHEDADVVLLDKVRAKTSPAAKRAKVDAKQQEGKVKAMRAALNGHSADVSTTSSAPLPSGATPSEENGVVQAPSLARTSSIAKRKSPETKPSSEEFINRALTVGSKGFSHQQAERAIHTADHELYKIKKNLRNKRQAKYDAARGAVELKEASAAAAEAAANMAAAVRSSAARNVARVVKRISKLQARMDGVARNNGKGCKPGETPATMKVKMAKLIARKSTLMAQATLAAKAAKRAISKAASVKGKAQANAINTQDSTTRLERAIVENARAKIQLARFDRKNQIKDQHVAFDKQQAKQAKAVDEATATRIKKAKEQYHASGRAAADARHAQAKARSDAFVKKNFKQLNVPSGNTHTVHHHHHHHHVSAAAKRKAENSVASKSVAPAASSGSKLKKAQTAVQAAHASGKGKDVKKALKNLKKVKSTPPK